MTDGNLDLCSFRYCCMTCVASDFTYMRVGPDHIRASLFYSSWSGPRNSGCVCEPGLLGCHGHPCSRDDLHLPLGEFLHCCSAVALRTFGSARPVIVSTSKHCAVRRQMPVNSVPQFVYPLPPARHAWPSKGAPYTDEVTAMGRPRRERCDNLQH